jgi:hypothetical protein
MFSVTSGVSIFLVPALFWYQRSSGVSIPLVSAFFWYQHFSGASIVLVFNNYTIYQKARNRRGKTSIIWKWGAEARITLDAFLLRAADRCT